MSETVKLTIDGREVEAPKGELLIKVAQEHGTYVPRFCWHERMKPVGMCRMCLVEIEGVRGLPPSCTTPVADGMVVHTESPAVRKVQDGVLEFLLINHPLDCPVCDRGGECPLQDQTLAFGPGESRFVEEKRHFEKPIKLSDLVLLDRERCIQCARCTRFADEVAGDPLIDFVDRGEQTQVLTFPDEPFSSYFSGNTVQICPVGALTASSYRFRARPWDLDTIETSCQTCAVGCRGALQSSSDRLVRFLGVDSEPVNHGWLCDKGRYGIEWVHAPERVLHPRIRKDDELVEASWPEALDTAASGLRRVLDVHGPAAIGVIGGARTTNEGAYVFARLAKGVLGTDNVDAQLGDGLPAELVLGLARAEIADCDRAAGIVALGPDIKEELPVLYLRVRRAAEDLGVPLIEITARDTGLSRSADAVVRIGPGQEALAARRVVEGLDGGEADDPGLRGTIERIRARDGELVVLLGRTSLATSPSVIEAAAATFARRPDVRFLSTLRRANVHGALDLGLAPGFLPGRVTLEDGRQRVMETWRTVPERRGLDTAGMLAATVAGDVKALVLVGADPLVDFPDAKRARDALAAAEHVVVVGAFADAASRADVVLPATLWGETRGSASNVEGRVARLGRKVAPGGTSMSDWRIAAELALRLGDDFDLEHVEEVQDEIATVAPAFAGVDAALIARARDGVVLPLTEHGDEVRLGGAPPVASEHSWDPIPSGSDALSSGIDEHGASAELAESIDRVGDSPASLFAFAGGDTIPDVPGRDRYALRLVVGRKLYDAGRVSTHSPLLSELAPATALLVSPKDRDRIGVSDGDEIRVTSARGTIAMSVLGDRSTPEGVAFVAFGQPSAERLGVGELIDSSSIVTDVQVETIR